MTEAEWLSCDLEEMLAFLAGKVSERKLRLFAVACCRHVWDRITDQADRDRVELVERFADGLADEQSAMRAAREAEEATRAAERFEEDSARAFPTWITGYPTQEDLVHLAAARAARAAAAYPLPRLAEVAANAANTYAPLFYTEGAAQRALLRDLVGPLPFRPVSVPASVRTWNDGAVVKLAQAIYDQRRFGDLPVLADALEEAGCDDGELLRHCRGPGPHVRGCWAVDLVLAKG